jgi:hypothetical protein
MDWTPYIKMAVDASVELSAMGVVAFISRGIPATVSAVQKKYNLQISASQTANLTTQAENVATWAFMQIPDLVTKLGWGHADVIAKVVELAAPKLAEKAPGSLNDVGLSPDTSDAANMAAIEDIIKRAIPAAAAKAAASPATPPADAGKPAAILTSANP